MDFQSMAFAGGVSDARASVLAGMVGRLRVDGLDGQEDELEDVEKGKLDPPTDDEGPGSDFDRNDRGRALESEDEDEELIRRRLERESLAEMERNVGIRPTQ